MYIFDFISYCRSIFTFQVADYEESEDPSPCESNLIVNVPVAREFKTVLLKSLSDDVVNFYLHKYSVS